MTLAAHYLNFPLFILVKQLYILIFPSQNISLLAFYSGFIWTIALAPGGRKGNASIAHP